MIIGISSKYDFGRWNHKAVSFETAGAAEKWLHAEEHDFREREIFDELRPAVELAGVEEVTKAIYGEFYSERDAWKTLRKAYNLTQAEMSEATGVPMRTLQGWENGTRTPPEYMLNLIETKLKTTH